MHVADLDKVKIDFDLKILYLRKRIHLKELYDTIADYICEMLDLKILANCKMPMIGVGIPSIGNPYVIFRLENGWAIRNRELLDLSPRSVTFKYILD